MIIPNRQQFHDLARQGNAIGLIDRLMSDQLTAVLGYRRLVSADERTAPSFLLESVEGGSAMGRYSFIGAQPTVEIIAKEHTVRTIDHRAGTDTTTQEDDPLDAPRRIMKLWKPAPRLNLPRIELPAFIGGFVGSVSYDTMRYLEAEKLPFSAAPHDDRNLPDMHLGLYRQVGVFDHVAKILYAVNWVRLDEHDSVDAAYDTGCAELAEYVQRLETHSAPIPAGSVDLDIAQPPSAPEESNFTREDFERAVDRTKEYISAGDAFQIVISQRFTRRTEADPFDIYRALRIVNPSPYMIYMQGEGAILIASSPEILCRVHDGVATSRPLAGTRKRGASDDADLELERDLLADEKERAEHVMLVDLGRNDLGRVCALGSIDLPSVLDVERYSHVMHLSSTVTGRLRDGLDCFDALRSSLPVGTVSGAPKVRAMQIIDELEPTRRGPYAGGIGCVSFEGDMDIAIALRTMVVPTEMREDGKWAVHLQAGAGVVADSVPANEYQETVNKAAALGRAIDLAERAFGE